MNPFRFFSASRLFPAALQFGLLAVTGAFAAGVPVDKRGYSLVNPTPVAAMRELSTDRPDQTESAYTVDAGHFQLEMDFVNFTTDRDRTAGGDLRTRVLAIAPVNLKMGLLNHVDLQLMVDPRVEVRVEDRVAGTVMRASGFGDVTTRLKINFWGNDGGKTAFAIMPFVKWPLSASDIRNGETEGGVIFPLAVELPGGWGMGLMTEFDFVSDGGGGYDTEWVNSITFAHDLTAKLGGYVEFFAVTSRAPGFKWQGQFDLGFTYALREDIQLDFGCNFGVTKSAPDFQPFVGISPRF
ncbi:MAG TPA: transporter [Opitutaceae bacterium]|nr:transporter [Opitutaceae bacterium]